MVPVGYNDFQGQMWYPYTWDACTAPNWGPWGYMQPESYQVNPAHQLPSPQELPWARQLGLPAGQPALPESLSRPPVPGQLPRPGSL